MVGWKLLNINIIQLGITNHHLHVSHHTFTAFICTLKSLLIQIKTTDPSIITRLRLNMTNWIHHNPNIQLICTLFEMMGWKLLGININQLGITKSNQHVFHCTAFIYTLKSLLKLPNYDQSIIHSLRSNKAHWIHHNSNYIINIYLFWTGGQ